MRRFLLVALSCFSSFILSIETRACPSLEGTYSCGPNYRIRIQEVEDSDSFHFVLKTLHNQGANGAQGFRWEESQEPPEYYIPDSKTYYISIGELAGFMVSSTCSPKSLWIRTIPPVDTFLPFDTRILKVSRSAHEGLTIKQQYIDRRTKKLILEEETCSLVVENAMNSPRREIEMMVFSEN